VQRFACLASRRKNVVNPAKYLKLTFSVAALIWFVDYITKQWALKYLPGKEISFLFIKLELTANHGAAFGLGANGAGVLLGAFAMAASAVAFYYAPKISNKYWATLLGLVLGGALGNLTDRAFNSPGFLRGPVTDWILLPHWPNFNLADTAIVIAAILAFVLSLKNIPPTEVKKSA
jgi:signal peptidase II